jgi:hypothetical protein
MSPEPKHAGLMSEPGTIAFWDVEAGVILNIASRARSDHPMGDRGWGVSQLCRRRRDGDERNRWRM